MANITIVELQAVAGGLQLAKRTLDDVLARVGKDPGPIQDPAAQAALASITASTQAITTDTQQIQAAGNPTGGGGSVP